jgi:hypothetical protein
MLMVLSRDSLTCMAVILRAGSTINNFLMRDFVSSDTLPSSGIVY